MRFAKLADAGNTSHEFENKLKKAYAYLRCTDFSDMADGKHEVCSDFYVNVSRYDTKPQSGARLEAHRKYADIQYILSGEEQILVADVCECVPVGAFDAVNDVMFYESASTPSSLLLTAGSCAVFMPNDAHCPSISANGKSARVEKVVVKVRIN